MSRLPIIMYHALESAEIPANYLDEGERVYILDAGKFETQMRYLRDNGITPLSLDEVLSGQPIAERSVLITFDDGHSSNETVALKILQRYRFPATFFITSGWIGSDNFMSEAQVERLHAAGMDIGTHGVSHRFLDDLSEDDAMEELAQSKATLERIVGQEVTTLSAPGGRLHAKVKMLAKRCGYRAVFTSKIALHDAQRDLFDIPRFDIKRDIDMADFARIVEADPHYIGKLTSRAKMLTLAKRLLGNDLYVKLRALALSLRG